MYHRERIIRDVPFIAWVMGIIIIGVGVYGFMRPFIPLWVRLLLIGIGFLMGALAPILNVYIDRGNRTLLIEKFTILGPRRQEVRIDRIERIYVERRVSEDSDGSSSNTYRVVLILDNGEKVPLRNASSSARSKHNKHAEAIRQAIGLDSVDRSPESVGEAMAMAMQMVPVEDLQTQTGIEPGEHETSGVHWQLETFNFAGATQGSPVYRWSSLDVDIPNDFVYITQRMEGTGQQRGLMKLAGKFLFKTSIQMYGFDESYTPGLDRAKTIEDVDKRLVDDFFVYTSDPAIARQLLNPWMVMPLIGWADRYKLQSGDKEFHQLSVLFSPLGFYISQLGRLDQAEIDELVSLGVELVKAKQ